MTQKQGDSESRTASKIGNRRNYLKAIGSLAVAGGFAGCLGSGGSSPEQTSEDASSGDQTTTAQTTDSGSVVNEEVEQLSFAAAVGASGVVATVLQEEGIAEKHNLSIEMSKQAPADAENALFQKTVDTGIFSPISAARANAEGQNIRVIAPNLNNHNSVLVKPDSEYESLDDLVGKRFGSFERITGAFNAFSILTTEMGYNFEEDFNVTFGGAVTLLNLLDRGDVEATLSFESFVTRWIARDNARELFKVNDKFTEETGHNNLFLGVAAHENWIQNNTSKAVKFHRALLDAQTQLHTNPDMIEKYSDVFGLQNQEEIDLGKERIPRVYPTEWNEQKIQAGRQDIQTAREIGIIPEDATAEIFWQPPE